MHLYAFKMCSTTERDCLAIIVQETLFYYLHRTGKELKVRMWLREFPSCSRLTVLRGTI